MEKLTLRTAEKINDINDNNAEMCHVIDRVKRKVHLRLQPNGQHFQVLL